MKKLLFLIVLIVCNSFVQGQQAPVIEWQKSLGGTSIDIVDYIQQNSEGGYIVSGQSESNDVDVSGNHGGQDAWVVKLSNSGTVQWQKSLGGPGADEGQCIRQTNDGGYIVVGYATANGGDVTGYHYSGPWPILMYDVWVVKLDINGTIEWQKCLGGSGVSDAAYSVQQTTDGGYIVGASTNSSDGDVIGFNGGSDYWIVKLDVNGTIAWQKCLGGTGGDALESLQQTSDGGYILAGFSNSQDGDVTGNHGESEDYWVVKTDTAGVIEWQKSFGGNGLEIASSIQQTADGGYFVTGSSQSVDGDITGHHGDNTTLDYWAVKLDSVGLVQWEKSLGGTRDEYSYYANVTVDGGFIISGFSQSVDGDVTGHHGSVNTSDFWLVKLDSVGTIQWEKSIGGTSEDRPNYVQQTNDGGYITGGYSNSNDGDATSNSGGFDYWVVKLAPDIIISIKDIDNDFFNLSLYPNPFITSFTLETTLETTLQSATPLQTEIRNLQGQLVYSHTENAAAGMYKKTIELNLTQGIYYLTLQSSEGRVTKKVEVVR